VVLGNAGESKDTDAAKEFLWQGSFPATQRTALQKAAEERRDHVQATPLQQAIQEAVGNARMDQRASAHTPRPSVASHWLRAHAAIRTIAQ
jgi:site-specific recombinase XerD